MKNVILSLFFALTIFSCRKSTERNCTNVIVTLKAHSCKGIGVIINGVKYPTDDLPQQYAIEGKSICIKYSFWEDMTMCQCCGGKKVHIIAVD